MSPAKSSTTAESLEAQFASCHPLGAQRRIGEAHPVDYDVSQRDSVAEARYPPRHRCPMSNTVFIDDLPKARPDEWSARRLQPVASGRVGIAVRLERDEVATVADRHLRAGKSAIRHLECHALE
jgi:hypothetical protein